MLALLKDKTVVVLMLLLAFTLMAWWLRYTTLMAPASLGVALLVLAFVKVQLIISQYMELHKAPVFIRIAFWSWTLLVCAISITLYRQ